MTKQMMYRSLKYPKLIMLCSLKDLKQMMHRSEKTQNKLALRCMFERIHCYVRPPCVPEHPI